MAVRTISTKLAVEGESEYKKSVQNINSELGKLKSELRLTESTFSGQANSYEALSAKGRVLTQMYEEQEKKLSAAQEMLEKWQEAQRKCAENVEAAKSRVEQLKEEISALGDESGNTGQRQSELQQALAEAEDALAAANTQYEKAGQKCNTYQKAVNDATVDLNNLGGELEQNQKYMDEAAGSSDKCADSIDQFGKKVNASENDVESFSDKLKNGLGSAAQTAGVALAAVGTAAAAGVGLLNNIAESTEEYRIAQGKLNTAFESAGYSVSTAKEAYQTLFSVLGDTDNATESAQLLAQLAQSEEDVSRWGQIAAGVTGTFGDALPINSLIEASNETAKVGQVTGALADALNWVGISEDEFNDNSK